MESYDAVVLDLDGCLTERNEPSRIERAIQTIATTVGGDSLQSGTKILRELAGIEPDYDVREDVQPYLEEADTTILLTGRPAWPGIRSKTEDILASYPEDFDSTIMYPGKTLEDEAVIDEQPGPLSLFTGDGIPAYKKAVIDEIVDEYESIAYIDDAADCHEAVQQFDIDQYTVNGELEPYNNHG